MTLTLAQELYRSGVTVNCIGPAGLTRITATMPGSGEAFEPDDVPEGEWNPMDPKNCSPLVAWLASDEADYVTGQVIRVIHDKIIWMGGWYERRDDQLRRQAVGRREARHAHGHRDLRDPPPGHGIPSPLVLEHDPLPEEPHMAMPTDVPIIDCMIGFPIADKKALYEFITKQTKDSQSKDEYEFPVEYMFKDVPDEADSESRTRWR